MTQLADPLAVEAALIRKAQSGDQAAIDALIDSIQEIIRRIAICISRGLAWDVASLLSGSYGNRFYLFGGTLAAHETYRTTFFWQNMSVLPPGL